MAYSKDLTLKIILILMARLRVATIVRRLLIE